MLTNMYENKIILNLHEQKFAELAMFQANTPVFQANTNAFLKNMETQVGQLALAMQNQSRDSFPSDTKKNPKDYMNISLRSGKELQEREEAEKKKNEPKTEKAYQNSVGCDKKQNNSRLSDERVR